MRLFISWLLVIALAACVVATAQKQMLSENEAIKLAAAISTAETESIARDKQGVDLESLRNHRFLQNLGAHVESAQNTNSNSFVVKGYDVRLTLTADRRQYTLTLTPKTPGCLPVYMTNESGQIYRGASISCTSGLQR